MKMAAIMGNVGNSKYLGSGFGMSIGYFTKKI